MIVAAPPFAITWMISRRGFFSKVFSVFGSFESADDRTKNVRIGTIHIKPPVPKIIIPIT